MKKCLKCGFTILKSNFHKKLYSKDGFNNQCRLCRKQYSLKSRDRLSEFYLDNRHQILLNQKVYYSNSYFKGITRKKIYFKVRYTTDINYRLIC